MRTRGITYLLILATLTPALADGERIQQWLKADSNGDGVLTLEETSGLMQRFFARNDTDSDGKLTKEKLKAAGAEEVTLMSFENGGHGVFGAKRDKTYPAMEAFFAKALRLES